ncbi:MAG: alpha/beta fold hydrolase [Polyangiales bacterium]
MSALWPQRLCSPSTAQHRRPTGIAGLSAGLLVLLAAACGDGSLPVSELGRFEPVKCWFPVPETAREVQCGRLTVPLRHGEAPTGERLAERQWLRLAVVRSLPAVPTDKAPVVFLHGGPGGSITDAAGRIIERAPDLFGTDREAIFFDQRGAGRSRPDLRCGLTDDVAQCRDRLDSWDLSAFNSTENAADVDALRRALGQAQLVLVGSSYGTSLAQHVLRDFPGTVESVVLDAVAPLDLSFIAESPRSESEAIDAFFAACAADAECGSRFAGLSERFTEAHTGLVREPLEVRAQLDSGRTARFLLDAGTFETMVLNTQLFAGNLAPVPRTIAAVARRLSEAGDEAFVGAAMLETFQRLLRRITSVASGAYWSIACADQPQVDPAALATDGLRPELVGGSRSSLAGFVEQCDIWDVPPQPLAERQPVRSDVPTLLFCGAFDPITPPRFCERVAVSLSRAQTVILPNSAHGALLSGECSDALFRNFIAAPTAPLDISCVQGPDFAFPSTDLQTLTAQAKDRARKAADLRALLPTAPPLRQLEPRPPQ